LLDRYRLLFDMSEQGNLEAVIEFRWCSPWSPSQRAGVLGVFLAFVFTAASFLVSLSLARLAVLPVALPPLVGVIAVPLRFW